MTFLLHAAADFITIRPLHAGGGLLRIKNLVIATVLALCVGACATVPEDPVARAEFERTNDPLEPMNRSIFDFNMTADKYVIRPTAEAYRDYVPGPARTAIRNIIDNLKQPVVFANNVLQGDPTRASTTLARFVLNSFMGIGGIFDIATDQGYPRQQGDFGQTLFVWGLNEGPYLMLPLLGPSNPRDGAGRGVDAVIDPWGYVADSTVFGLSRLVVDGVDERSKYIEELDNIERTSLDFYATIRSLARQRRVEQLYHGNPPPPSFDDSLYSDPAAPKQ
jgi:phospholipid-binding lipoprotein MlaA